MALVIYSRYAQPLAENIIDIHRVDEMKSSKYFVAMALVLMIFLSGCVQKEESKGIATAEGTAKIGVIQSLTVDLGAYGGPMCDAMKIAAKEINANGGLLGKQVQLLIEDDQTNNVAAVDAVNKLVKVDRVPAIVGATGSGPSMSIIDIATKSGVLQISSSNTGIEFTNYNDSDLYFRTCPSDALQGAAMAELAKKMGYKTASTIVINNPYGVGFEDVFVKAFEADGSRVLDKVRYDPSQTVFDSEVQKVVSSKPDFVMMVSYPETGSLILKTAYEKGALKGISWLLSEGLMAENLANLVGKDSSGKYIVAGFQGLTPDPSAGGSAYEAFSKKYVEENGKQPGIYCSNSYDALALVALAIEQAKNATGRAIADNIRSVANPPGVEVSDLAEALKLVREGKDINYQGASGEITFDKNGDVSGSYSVWTVADNGSIVFGEKIAV
ncbi:Chemotactic signal transduction system substrate-binding protein BasB [uncultured archaeon]|nr:Chemotactic signal transduction system substrate-binding protein BasB [uncultured archaeon]